MCQLQILPPAHAAAGAGFASGGLKRETLGTMHAQVFVSPWAEGITVGWLTHEASDEVAVVTFSVDGGVLRTARPEALL